MSIAADLRPDLAAIAEMIPEGARVLDVGCGDGALLEHLMRTKKVDGRGIELSQQNVNACVARGLAVVQGDADTDLVDYPAQVFDVVILSQTIQATRDARAGARAICCASDGARRSRCPISGIGGCACRCCSADACRAPGRWTITGTTRPNIHLCTIADFVELARKNGAVIDRALALKGEIVAGEMRARCLGSQSLRPRRDLPAAQKLKRDRQSVPTGFSRACARARPAADRAGAGVAGA